MIEDEDIEIEDTQREDRHDLMMRLLMWREKHINEHNFVLILRNLYCRRCSHS